MSAGESQIGRITVVTDPAEQIAFLLDMHRPAEESSKGENASSNTGAPLSTHVTASNMEKPTTFDDSNRSDPASAEGVN